MSESIKVPIKIHPRAFSAFGEDLITNENIAMIELVKNSYDAYALKLNLVLISAGYRLSALLTMVAV